MNQTEVVIVVANSAWLQQFSGDAIRGTTCGDDPTQRKSTFTTKTRETALVVAKTNTPDREVSGNYSKSKIW